MARRSNLSSRSEHLLVPCLLRGARPFGHSIGCKTSSSRGDSSRLVVTAASTTQFPPYQIILKGDKYDLRLYGVHPIVVTPYEKKDEGYAALGAYFDGANSENVRFAESQPVIMTYYPEGDKFMHLFVGDTRGGDEKPATVPQPVDRSLAVDAAGGELVACLQFDGYVTPETAAAARKKLINALEADGLRLADAEQRGLFRVAQYGPLFNLTRLNELMLAVKA